MTQPRRLRPRLLALSAAAALTLGLGAVPATAAPAVAAAPAGPTTAATVSAPVAGLPDASLAQLRRTRPGLDRLLTQGTSTGRAIVTLESRSDTATVRALRSLGLTVRPMRRLPLVVVEGPVASMTAAVVRGLAADVYPDEQLEYTDTASSEEMSSSPAAARTLRRRGFTGQGVTVGVVDSGCDATHPDLAQRVTHNVLIVSPEYANLGTAPLLPVPLDQGPYSNTDLGSGHGTHVAGIIAADGSSSRDHLGVAPDADLACFAIGAVITTAAVVSAYDYILSQPGLLGIDVINNSWGNSFRQYDPADPVNVATRAAARRGVVSVFAAGNSGSDDAESSVSPFNQAPWVLSVAAGDLDRHRGSFSSNGLRFDNGQAVPIGRGGHTVATGDRVGTTMPDVMAPGVSISSTCDSTGSAIGPCPTGGNATASGTSMSSPHVAGAAAVLLSANRRLSVRQVQLALTSTATPVTDEDGARLRSWQVGFGHVNLDAAVHAVRVKGWQNKLARRHRQAVRRLAREDAWDVRRADLWQDDAPVVTVGTYRRTRVVRVGRGVEALKLTLVYPTPGTAANLARYTARVKDASGKVVATTTTDTFYSHGTAAATLRRPAAGRYTIEVVGDYSVSDPDTIDSDSLNGRVVFLQAAQLDRR
ncbi:MAG: hypothetical protein CMH83_03255 [Nocardioides sp.]|nr:hypothetical protein [Nocardioides sp.]